MIFSESYLKMDFEYIKYSREVTPDLIRSRFPGFYSDDCYFILADYFNKKCKETLKRKIRDDDVEVEESKVSKEVKLEEDVTRSEQLCSECECYSQQSGEVQRESVQSKLRFCESCESTLGQSSIDLSEQMLHDTTNTSQRSDDVNDHTVH